MNRFSLTKVRVVKSHYEEYKEGELYIAITDTEDTYQLYGLIHHGMDAKLVFDKIQESNESNEIAMELADPDYVHWVTVDDVECEEV